MFITAEKTIITLPHKARRTFRLACHPPRQHITKIFEKPNDFLAGI